MRYFFTIIRKIRGDRIFGYFPGYGLLPCLTQSFFKDTKRTVPQVVLWKRKKE